MLETARLRKEKSAARQEAERKRDELAIQIDRVVFSGGARRDG